MKALGSNYTDCAVLIYDEAGNHLGDTTVANHDRIGVRVEVQELPAALHVGSICKLLILSSPAPCEYEGRIVSEGARRYIAMYHGKEKENRTTTRYKVSTPAIIENLVYNGRAYPLHTPIPVSLVDISKSGVRFQAPYHSFSDGDRFQMRMKISSNEKYLIADVVHHADNEALSSEYGCNFLVAR